MSRDNDGYDDKRRRSWSEVDKMRDGKRSRPSPGAPRERINEKSAGYGRLKSAADAFFSGALMPESLGEKLDPTGEGRARKQALQKLSAIDDFGAFNDAAKAYVDQHGLFDDPYLLDRLLGHTSDALVLKTLAHLGGLVDAGGFKVPKSLPERLKSLEIGSDEPEVQDAAKALRQKLASQRP
jgi:hypothetical protein